MGPLFFFLEEQNIYLQNATSKSRLTISAAAAAELTRSIIQAVGNMLITIILGGVLGAGVAVAQSSASSKTAIQSWIPEPLPSVTPDGVVNLFIQEMDGYAGLFEASVIKVEASSTTYWVACASSISEDACPFDPIPPYTGMTVTQGAKGMQMTNSEEGWSVPQSCTFATTAASVATCTNYWSVGHTADEINYSLSTSYTDQYTRTYVAKLPYKSWRLEHWGQPPFIPVSITAGAEKLVAAASARTTSSGPISTSSQNTGTGIISPAPAAAQLAVVSQTSTSAVSTETANSGAWRGRKSDGGFVLRVFVILNAGIYIL
ncbi:hypothetical protein ONS95_012938 [Cadophora gregata]|uniref:uncharacterized protein n=1 Tax=Cadophora gregata TaxID=51156 RepID=UPI0026DD6B4E|nr:uncharacterized protein ONS95_012938 [Cadophora gregata]KAK0101077.1 hypothetical protein ONS96_006305 [Cadophora gregata f. sp. sojae]KAK0115892.1 hypothetical protein ONS95_012938 [Cadophora gregata]